MAGFDVSKEWVILLPSDTPQAEKSAEDLSRYIGLLAAGMGSRAPKQPAIVKAPDSVSRGAEIVLNNEGSGPERNGFVWRAAAERVEIFGESGRGLCNGIYSFLSALGINWPAPGREELPAQTAKRSGEVFSPLLPLASESAREPSRFEGKNPAAAPWRRFVPDGHGEIKEALGNGEAFAAWAARSRYDAVIFPLAAFASGKTRDKLTQLKQAALEYGIAVEAGGRDLSSLVPRRYFFFHRESFRMEEGKRVKAHHFCPTSLGAERIIKKEARKLFRAAAGTETFHLWPDKGAETAWCSCPTCRAFTPREQNRMGVNAAANILAAVAPAAAVTCFEKPTETCGIRLGKNVCRIEKLPGE